MGGAERKVNIPALNRKEYIGGVSITTTVQETSLPNITPTDLDEHEAEHAVVAIRRGTGVRRLTVRAGKGFMGMVEPYSFDPVAAATSHSRRGRDHDMGLAAKGGNLDASISAAKSYIGENQKEIHAVAIAAHIKGDLSGHEIEDIMDRVHEEPKQNVVVNLKKPDGEVTEKIVQVGDNVIVPWEWFDTAKADKERRPTPLPRPSTPEEPEEELPFAA